MSLGKFITLEGGEGTGKSTQAKLLRTYLESCGLQVVLTREPGGSPGAELIRHLLVEGAPDRWDPLSEYLLFSAARRNHMQNTIMPALREGCWVICDRFYDSSRVYQGVARGLNLEFMDKVYEMVAEGIVPDLTFLFDLPAELGHDRVQVRMGREDRFEQMGVAFHQKVRNAYLKLAEGNPDRFRVIDARGYPEAIADDVIKVLVSKFPELHSRS